MKYCQPNKTYCLILFCTSTAFAEEAAKTFEQHTRSQWLNDINHKTEAITRNPEPIIGSDSTLIMEKPEDHQHRQQLERFYHHEDFDGLQTFGEYRATQLETEQSPEGEAWRLLNQSPDRYYPDANEHRILGAMELGVNALQHPNTWSKQKHWPTDAQGNPVYDSNAEMSATIARLRQHFKGCDYQKTLVLKPDRQVHSPDIRECTRALVTDDSVTLSRKIRISPFLEYVSSSGLAGMNSCESSSVNEGCIQIRLGKDRGADNYYRCGCCIKEETFTVTLPRPEALTRAVIQEARWDDRMQIWINDHKVWQSNGDFPPESGGGCELDSNFYLNSPVVLDTALVTNANRQLTFKIRTSVGGDGEGYALVKMYFDTSQLVEDDRWTPASALAQLQKMRQWQLDGLCNLSYQCLESISDAEHTLHGKVIPLRATLSPQLPSDCKIVRAEADCFYYKTAASHYPPDHCTQYANDPNCEFVDSRCLGEKNTICYTRQDRYDCGYTENLNRIGIKESIQCEGQPMQCMSGECQADITEADNSDFASAVSGLHAAKHMAHDMQCSQDGTGCRIFSGKACTCKQGIFNMVDCCNLPTNVNFASYINLLLMGYLFDKSAIHLQSNYPNQLTGHYQKMREPLMQGINKLSQPAKNLWSQMGKTWDKLSEKLWPTPAEVHTQTATSKPIAGELSQEAQKSMLGNMQQQLMRKMAEVVQKVLGEDATNLLFRTVGDNLASQSGQLSQQALMLNPAITSAISAVTMLYTAYTMTKLIIQITNKCGDEEFELAAKREMKTCHRVGSYKKSKLLGISSMKYNSYCCFNSPLSRILQVQIRQQLHMGWGSARHPDCSGITPEVLQIVDWNQIDLSEWLALLKLQNKLPELNADTLKQLNLETLTGKGSRLDFDEQREDSRKRLEARYEGISPAQLDQYQGGKTEHLRSQIREKQ
ncbi:conjugal transfer protein TraN [Endozoicomonas gorgoniicola]|uniref:Conjugal transfer protein TraN n=1 Tax=Endozoicomonas gorgoniicola TaxID=1234144 RepID=A0ABT3MTW1_9GAMM|nr:conjugal transfer protein TraN [Endozoicomonas gorgoniicola]MCW7552834.1 conjugal transfer protein TraN [Endozoicomonas gorgoniicola]